MEPKLKVSKHGNSRLPDVFIQPRNIIAKDRDRKHSEKAVAEKQKSNIQQKQPIIKQSTSKKQIGDKKKSRNPFLPIHEWFKLSKQMDARINEVRQGLQMQKFSRFSFENNPDILGKEDHKQNKIKYEDCITLNLLKKNQNFCMKRILHVPTFTIYFLRESLIDYSSIDKNDLQQWIRKCNSSDADISEVRPQKIIKMFWNIPQNFYSLIYEYCDGVEFDLMLQHTCIFPMSFVQNMGLTHLRSDLQIFNSTLIIQRNTQSDIHYLPIYEEVDDIIPQYRTFRQLMKMNGLQHNQNMRQVQQKLVARLGFFTLVALFSAAIIDEDISNILFQSKDCCLFHKQMANPNSLIKIFVESNFTIVSEKQILSDFFCKMLKFKPQQRTTFSQLSKHRFFKTKFTSQTCQMHEVISALQCSGSKINNSSRPMINKMGKLIGDMSLILQGNEQFDKKPIDLSPSNQNIRYFLREIGLANNEAEFKVNINQLIPKLRRVYDF